MTSCHFQLDIGARGHITPPGSSQKLVLFIVASVALHCLIFALPGTFPRSGSHVAPVATHVDVYLASAQQPVHQSANRYKQQDTHHAKRIRHTTATAKPHKRHVQQHKPATSSKLSQRSPQWFHTPTTDASPGPATTQQTQHPASQANEQSASDPAAVALLLRQALLKHFYYPPIARQNAWQGKVVLSVLVKADGRVDSAQVLRPSHYAILNRAARRAADAIGVIPAARPLLAGQNLSFRVPVAYRLHRE